jgi:hypothetical protein
MLETAHEERASAGHTPSKVGTAQEVTQLKVASADKRDVRS